VPITQAPPRQARVAAAFASEQSGRADAAIDAAREAALRAREAYLQRREDELAEQRRVLAEQARLLHDTRPESSGRQAHAPGAGAPWPPVVSQTAAAARPLASASPRVAPSAFVPPSLTPRQGLWQKVRRALVGDQAALDERS
jgi:hypothetical protein